MNNCEISSHSITINRKTIPTKQLTANVSEDVGKEKLSFTFSGMRTIATTLGINTENLKKIKTVNLPHNTHITILGIYPENSAPYSTVSCSAMFSAAIFTIVRK